MKVYWSDRQGRPPPPHATFHLNPFSSGKEKHFTPKFVDLPPPKVVQVLKRTFFPSFPEWETGVEKALKIIEKKELEKVVLGRICILELKETPDPFAITAALKQQAKNAFVFCIQLADNEYFLGASPERLFYREGQTLFSEAIAGTRPRGKTLLEDDVLRKELLESPKDLREFTPVKQYLEKTLSPFCVNPLVFSPLSIHPTNHVQHLYSRCTGTLKDFISDQTILSSLHPTPALCGTPTETARHLIKELEPFDRGFFGGTVGWSTPEASEQAVAIRSCHIKDNIATLFSGTGIVEGSKPKEEWEELNHKLKLYDRILVG